MEPGERRENVATLESANGSAIALGCPTATSENELVVTTKLTRRRKRSEEQAQQ